MVLLLLFITFIQGIYTYIPETSYASRVYSFATILIYNLCHMLFPMRNVLKFYVSIFRSMCEIYL
jgi:hypothetical protein